MRRFHVVSMVVVLLLIVFASACAPRSEPVISEGPPLPTTSEEIAEPAITEEVTKLVTSGEFAEPQFPDFDANNFDNPTVIDNEWDPMQPGTKWAYEGTAVDDEGNNVDRRIEFTVTDLTKKIEGVRTVVGWIEDFTDGELTEKEIASYAQDNDGNVWYFGEHPEDYENGKFIEAPTWIAGFQDAKPGIVMMAKPEVGGPSVYQGWGPEVGWSDYGQVEQMGQKTCVPVDCYEDVLVNAEANLDEKGAFQLKYFARGVGEVQVGWKGTDATKEELQLVEYEQLSPEGLADVRAKALEVEKHAYQVSEVYKQTSPAEYPVGTPAIDIAEIPVAEPTQSSAVAESSGSDIIVYASDLPQNALSELDFIDDPASPGGKLVGLPNNGDELDPPPEDDPHAIFKVQVQSGNPYRCWIHMKVGSPKGASKANVIWVQFSNALDESNQEILKPGSGSYLTAEGPTQEGWTWVECDRADSDADSLFYFGTSGEVTVRLQAGAEGVGFDQLILSPAKFLDTPPSEPIVDK